MKIYQMMHFPLEGAGTGIYVDSLAGFLVKKGHQLQVLCSHHYLPVKSYPVEAVLFSNGENEKFELDFDFPVFASHPLSKGKKFGELSQTQRKAYFQAFRNKIENGLAQFKPDIVHVHHGWVIASILADFDIPYLITLHGTEYHAFKDYKDYQEDVLRGIHGAEIIVALTESERTQAIDAYGLDQQRTTVITSGTDTDMFRPLEVDKGALLRSYSIETVDRPVVFFGGRLTARKGIETLLRAASMYSKTDEMPITLIAGDGDLRKEFERLAEELKLDSVYFLGSQDHERMVKLFNVADVAAMLSEFEAFGLVAVEALACGTPVITSDIGGFSRIVNEQVGCLLKPDDFKSLAEKVIGFIRDGFKEKVRDKAAAYIKQNFSWDKTVENVEKLYEQVLGRHNKESDSRS